MQETLAINFRVLGEQSWRVTTLLPSNVNIVEAKATSESPLSGQKIEFACVPITERPAQLSLIIPTDQPEDIQIFLTEEVHFEMYGPAPTDPRWRSWLDKQATFKGGSNA